MRERIDSEFSPMSLLLGGRGLDDLMAELESRPGGLFGEGIEGEDGTGITEEVENKYLTMSWWMLHVGWKDVMERVRRGVEEVFDGCVLRHQILYLPSYVNLKLIILMVAIRVSLKTKLGVFDLHRLISDVHGI
jgi:Peroxin-3.